MTLGCKSPHGGVVLLQDRLIDSIHFGLVVEEVVCGSLDAE